MPKVSLRASLGLLIPLFATVLVGCVGRINAPEGWGGGAISDGVLYMGSRQGDLLALDASTGETKWRFPTAIDEDDGAADLEAVYGTPVLHDEVVYIGGYDGRLYAFAPDLQLMDSEPVGGLNPDDKFSPIVGGPAVAEDIVVVGSSDGSVYAFDVVRDGEDLELSERWSFGTEGRVWSTPAISDGVVFFGSMDHSIYAVDLDSGELVWRFPSRGAVATSPVVADGRVYGGSFDGVFYAIDAETGEERWRFEGSQSWLWAKPVTDEESIYVASLDGNLYALERGDGELRWILRTDGAIVGSPVVMSDLIVVPSTDGTLRVATLAEGEEIGICNIEDAIRTPLVEREGFVYLGVVDGTIRALDIDANGEPDEEWVHKTDEDDPLARRGSHAC